MVFFNLVDENALFLRYEYLPEGNRNLKPGYIKVDLVARSMDVESPAEQDRVVTVSKKSRDEMKDFINELRIKNGEPELTEEEWPESRGDLSYYLYASAVMEKIDEALEEGEVLKEGQSKIQDNQGGLDFLSNL